MVTSTGNWLTTWATAADFDGPKPALPAYEAVIWLVPTGRVLSFRTALALLLRETSPRSSVPAVKSTSPVNVPACPVAEVTVAVRVTSCPTTEGFGELCSATAEGPLGVTVVDRAAGPEPDALVATTEKL